MQNPSDLFRFESDADADVPRSGVLVVAVGSFIDAGKIQGLLGEHLVESGDPETVAAFDVDQLVDYRDRRPTMIFDRNRWDGYDSPELLLRRLSDRDGRLYYLLTGPEPDFQWERLVEAVRELIDRLDVSLVVTVHGIPMGVPHTRPIGMTSHATDPELIGEARSPFGRVQVPASFPALLEYRLGEAGQRAVGFAIHVPHYLAASEFAEGALAALNAVVDATGLSLPNDGLVEKAEVNRRAIAAEIEDNDEVKAIVEALEQQYDAFMRGQQAPNLWVPEGSQIPSADQLGAEFEDFLRTISDDEGRDPS